MSEHGVAEPGPGVEGPGTGSKAECRVKGPGTGSTIGRRGWERETVGRGPQLGPIRIRDRSTALYRSAQRPPPGPPPTPRLVGPGHTTDNGG